MKGLSRSIAFVFHPLFMPLYAALIVMYFITYFEFAINPWIKGFLLIVITLNILAPAISMGTMVRKKVISDIQVIHRRERFIPLMLICVYYTVSYILLRYKLQSVYIPDEMYSMLLGVILSILAAILITSRVKVSIHAIGVSGVLGTLVALGGSYHFDINFSELFWVNVLILILGLVGYSRISTGHHTLFEFILGGLVGFGINYFLVSTAWFV